MMPILRVSASCALRAIADLPVLSPLKSENHPVPTRKFLKFRLPAIAYQR
jgi:hypothetical protein